MKILRFEIEDFKAIQALTVDAQGNHVRITGPNASGKTSALDALWLALGGTGAKAVEEPVRDGEERASVTITLEGGIVVKRTWPRGKASTVTVTSNDQPMKSPAAVLKDMISPFSINPFGFMDLRPSEQVNDLLKVAQVEAPVEAVEKITGQRFTPREDQDAAGYLEGLCGDGGTFYGLRRDANVELRQVESALDEARQRLQEMGPGQAAEPVEIEALQSELEQMLDVQKRRQAADDRADAATEDERTLTASLDAKRDEWKRLQHQMETVKEEADDIKGKIEKAKVIQNHEALDRDSIPDQSEQIAQHRTKIAEAATDNQAGGERRLAESLVEEMSSKVATATKSKKVAERRLDKLRKLRKKILDDLDIGVDGVSCEGGKILFEGRPFSDCSRREQLSVACAVAMLQDPKIKILRIDNGEALDEDSLDALLAAADEKGYQVIMTAVRSSDGLEVNIEDAD